MNIIVAVYGNWGIGRDGSQPVVVPGDRRRFAVLTVGNTVIAGRKTLADFPGGAPLPDRRNIILSRNDSFKSDGAVVVYSLEELFAALRGVDPNTIFVIGGGGVYRLLLPYCKRAHVTKISATPVCDAFFPNLDAMPGWMLTEKGETLESGGVCYSHDLYMNNFPAKLPGEEDAGV